MATLGRELRRQLASTVTKAREAAERGACKALEALAVDRPEAFAFMDEPLSVAKRTLNDD